MRESLGFRRKPRGEVKAGRTLCGRPGRTASGQPAPALPGRLGLRPQAHPERTRWDPKDGELCLVRTKSGETLMEVRSDSDVQIDRQSWV